MTSPIQAPDRKCSVCGSSIDSSTHPFKDVQPRPGDVSLCLYCGNAAVFTADGQTLRPPTKAEAGRLAADPEVAAYQKARAATMARFKQ